METDKIKYSYKSFKSDKHIGDSFEIHCKKLGLGLKESVDIVFDFIVKNNISPDDLEYIWKKRTREELSNAKGELMNVHNLSVGFLRTFEKNQEAFWKEFKGTQLAYQKNLIQNLEIAFKDLLIQKEVLNEILYNSQSLLILEDEDFGKKIANRNWDNIIKTEKKVLNDNKT